MPNQSINGYIAIQDEMGNLYDMRPITIKLEGRIFDNVLPFALLGGVALLGVGAIAYFGRHKNKKKQTSPTQLALFHTD